MEQSNLTNFQNYYMYDELIKNKKLEVDATTIDSSNWEFHYKGILNILRDGIETPEVQNLYITVYFNGNKNESVDLMITDYYLNLIMWFPIIFINKKIQPQHLFFEEHTTGDTIKAFIDKYIVEPNKIEIENRILNNAIADTLFHFSDVDDFSLFLANTLNLEDDIDIMQHSKAYYDLLHADLSGVPIGEVKDRGMELVHDAIDNYIMKSKEIVGYDHCLKYAFGAKEGINIRQYKENNINIGTKPDGQGSIYHDIINKSYINGGLNTLVAQYIDNGASRVAQIISKKNVGDSGAFARILGLNNMDTFLNSDPHFDCGTNNFINLLIKDAKHLKLLEGRYYRFERYGAEYKINTSDSTLIGKRVFLRSPITCKSNADGHGICYKCYGDLAYTNRDISIGRIATEHVTSQYTQKRLSAKHLLETVIEVVNWNSNFHTFLEIENVNTIVFKESLFENKNMNGWKFKIDYQDLQVEGDDEFFEHNKFSNDSHATEDSGPFMEQFITKFYIVSPKKEEFIITAVDDDGNPIENKMYLSNALSSFIYNKISENELTFDTENTDIVIPLNELQDIELFLLKIQNNDLGKSLDIFTDIINKKNVTKSFDKDTIVESLQDAALKGGVKCQSIHLETILSSQICSEEDKLKKPDWSNPDAKYEILTLNEALTNNKSIIVTLDYQKLGRALFQPINHTKTEPSILDPFFMAKPKKFLTADHEIWSEVNKSTMLPGECPIIFTKDKSDKIPRDIRKHFAFRDRPKTEIDD